VLVTGRTSLSSHPSVILGRRSVLNVTDIRRHSNIVSNVKGVAESQEPSEGKRDMSAPESLDKDTAGVANDFFRLEVTDTGAGISKVWITSYSLLRYFFYALKCVANFCI